ncbi:MAG: hypothetical protein GY765_23400, partial [bacterium]|nr:hypothetical protein [bacterium]
ALVLVFVIGILGVTMSDAAANYNTSPCYKVGYTVSSIYHDGDGDEHLYLYTYMGNCTVREERFEKINGQWVGYLLRSGPGWCNCKPGKVDGGAVISPGID